MVKSIAERYLEGLTRANMRVMRASPLPSLYRSGIRWSLEDIRPLPLAHTLAKRGRAACGPIAAYRAAELRRAGEPARVVVRRSASGVPGRWHAVVKRGDGRIEDPSRRLGMPAPRAFVGSAGPTSWPSTGNNVRLRWRRVPGGVRVGLTLPTHSKMAMIGVECVGVDLKAAATNTMMAASKLLRSPVVATLLPPQARLAIAAGAALMRTKAGRLVAQAVARLALPLAKLAFGKALSISTLPLKAGLKIAKGAAKLAIKGVKKIGKGIKSFAKKLKFW